MAIKSSLDKDSLTGYVQNQLSLFFLDKNEINKKELGKYLNASLDRLFFSFSKIKDKYYRDQDYIYFNHLHGDHYATLLYLISNEAYRENSYDIYQKTSLLNKYLHGIDLFGHIQLPDIFQLVHPLGTVIGRAAFKDYLVIYQGVTIGGVKSDDTIHYPSFGENVTLYSNSSVLGSCEIGSDVILGANTKILNMKVPSNSLVLGIHPNNKLRKPSTSQATNFFFKNPI